MIDLFFQTLRKSTFVLTKRSKLTFHFQCHSHILLVSFLCIFLFLILFANFVDIFFFFFLFKIWIWKENKQMMLDDIGWCWNMYFSLLFFFFSSLLFIYCFVKLFSISKRLQNSKCQRSIFFFSLQTQRPLSVLIHS